MPQSKWKLRLLDSSFTAKGRVSRARNIKARARLNQPVVITYDLDQDARLIADHIEFKSYIKAYRGDTLRAFNHIASCRDTLDSDGGTAEITTVGPGYLLGRRNIQATKSWTLTDQGAIVKELIDDQNARKNTYVRTGQIPIPATTQRTVQFDTDKNVLESIRDLSTAYDGFDFDIEPVDGQEGVMGDLHIWETRGIVNDRVFFEYARGKRNALTVTVENLVNKLTSRQVIIGRDQVRRVMSTNTDMEAAYGHLFDSADTFADIAETPLLDKLGEQLGAWRANPRQIVAVQPSPTADYWPWDDYDLGDYVHLRAKKGRVNIDGLVRVFGWDIEIDETGAERVTSLIVSPNDQGDIL